MSVKHCFRSSNIYCIFQRLQGKNEFREKKTTPKHRCTSLRKIPQLKVPMHNVYKP